MVFRVAIVIFAFAILAPQLEAQGIFDAFGIPKTVTATGHTEVLGSVIISHRQNTTLADTLVIDVSPLRITNGNAADIQLTTSGSLTFGAITIEAAEGRVRIPMNAGGTTGSLRVDGIRVSLAGSSATSVTARLSWGGSLNFFNNSSVVVVDQVQSGLAADPMTDRFTVFNSTVYDSTATVVLREGFKGAFSNSTAFGQNTATQLRIRVTDFPTGLQFTFPATVTSADSSASLNTVEGTAITIPRSNGQTEVTYNFAGASNSVDVLESFSIPFTVAAQGTVANLQPTIEVGLFPVGAAVPTDALPSTSVPRFAEENLVVLEGTSRIITKTSYWTGIDTSRENRLSLLNPGSTVANVTLSAFDAAGQLLAGTNITNSVRLSLAANQSSNQTLREIFGTGSTGIATVRVQSTRSDLLALGTASTTAVLESAPLVTQTVFSFTTPAFGDETKITLFNPQSTRVTGTVVLRSAAGTTLATRSLELNAMTTTTRTTQDLFGTQSSGQIFGNFDAQIVALQSSGSANDLSFIAPQPPAGLPFLYVPFFTTGGGYETDLSLINTSTDQVGLTARIYDNSGAELGSARIISLAPNEQISGSVSEIFQLAGTRSGYLQIQVPVVNRAFFSFYPLISGHVRIRSGQAGAAVIPIVGYPQPDSYVLNSGTASGRYQGLAVVNPGVAAVTVTLQALSTNGTVLSTTSFEVGAGKIHSKLISELFSASVAEGSVIRVSATGPVFATSITGSTSGDMLRSSPALR